MISKSPTKSPIKSLLKSPTKSPIKNPDGKKKQDKGEELPVALLYKYRVN